MAIKLAIVTPEAEALSIECDEVVAPGANGDLGLLPGHIPLITALRPGVLTVIKSGKSNHYAVSTGFAEIEHDTVTILTASCESKDQIDLDAAKAALTEAERALKDIGENDAKYPELSRARNRAQARIDTAER
ncbi:MAG: F0F1 ATP synthase subunit epsilon [Myxococcota bacterium]